MSSGTAHIPSMPQPTAARQLWKLKPSVPGNSQDQPRVTKNTALVHATALEKYLLLSQQALH